MRKTSAWHLCCEHGAPHSTPRHVKLHNTLIAASLAIFAGACSTDAFIVDECSIIRKQYAQSQAMLSAAGREMDQQAARDGYTANYRDDMLATDKAMYEAMLRSNGCR